MATVSKMGTFSDLRRPPYGEEAIKEIWNLIHEEFFLPELKPVNLEQVEQTIGKLEQRKHRNWAQQMALDRNIWVNDMIGTFRGKDDPKYLGRHRDLILDAFTNGKIKWADSLLNVLVKHGFVGQWQMDKEKIWERQDRAQKHMHMFMLQLVRRLDRALEKNDGKDKAFIKTLGAGPRWETEFVDQAPWEDPKLRSTIERLQKAERRFEENDDFLHEAVDTIFHGEYDKGDSAEDSSNGET